MVALGRYELLRPLARGGMAEVFLARRRAAGVEKRLVIKRILAERARDPRFLELFVREARLSMALAHQNIVPVFDFGRIGDALFLAMEHVEGHDLGRTLARGPRLPPVVAAFVAAECCQALDHAHHRRGPDGTPLAIVHRDVTPRNVLVSDAGDVKLVDFGVAALGGEGGDKVRGTPAYMAPEQARGEPTDGRADLYGLGLVLWELLTGARARRGADVPALLAEARSGVLPEVPETVPPALARVLTRVLAVRPEDRYPDAHAMFDDLDSFVVAARAAEPASEAPKRRLAAWLRDAWVGDDEAVEVAGEMMAGRVVTFIDDGADAVVDRTARSLADTLGDASVEPAALAPIGLAPAAIDEAALAPPDAGPAVSGNRTTTRRWIGLAVALGGAAVIAMIAWPRLDAARPVEERAAPPTAPIAAPTVGAGPVAAPALPPVLDGAHPPTPPTATGAPVPLAGSGAARDPDRDGLAPRPRVGSAGRDPVRPPAPPPAGSAVGSGSAVIAVAPRHVTIGATPWANFQIDDDPAPHQTPETVELAPGRHRIHFENPELHVLRDVVLDVPVDHDLRHVEPMAQ